ncbi:MAG: hypothetical protein H7Z20_03935 [Bdellovibrio sp.]|nr:hypothetical protein [Methylotenera sp.]
MSLLIKALHKAEEAQAQNVKAEQAQHAKAEASAQAVKFERTSAKNKPSIAIENAGDMVLSLAPASKLINDTSLVDALLADAGVVKSGAALSASPKNAANVFNAKGATPSNGNKNLAVIAGLALFALLGMGAYFVQFIDKAPEMAMPARASVAMAPVPQPTLQPAVSATHIVAAPTQAGLAPIADNPLAEPTIASAKAFEATPVETTAFEPRRLTQKQLAETQLIKARITPQKRTTKQFASSPELTDDETMVDADNTIDAESNAEVNAADAPIIISKKVGKAKTGQAKTSKLGKMIASESASISVTKSQGEAGVNPILMSAYQAYIEGKDSQAQKLYKQVLQRDVHSVDALLGLGAIAQRQGRAEDANGWYGKVLEVEPRNNIARAALIDNQAQGNEQNNESHIKSMLAKQPDDANLHAALGNLYAEQNQWPAAQQAYFDAYRYHASADNAFNLAVSLDQMGKSKLALPYYQRALTLLQTGSNNIDKAALEARIVAIQ